MGACFDSFHFCADKVIKPAVPALVCFLLVSLVFWDQIMVACIEGWVLQSLYILGFLSAQTRFLKLRKYFFLEFFGFLRSFLWIVKCLTKLLKRFRKFFIDGSFYQLLDAKLKLTLLFLNFLELSRTYPCSCMNLSVHYIVASTWVWKLYNQFLAVNGCMYLL